MATFSTNQARQIYVAKQQVTVEPSSPGDIQLVAPQNADYIYFLYRGPKSGSLMRSDLIKKDLITTAKLTHGNNIEKFLKQYEVSLDPSVSATPVAGQEYLLRIDMVGYAALGLEHTYQKFGYVKGTVGMTAAQFYGTLAKSLAKNFAREDYPVYTFWVSNGTTETEIKATTKESTFPTDSTKLVIHEVSGPWRKGTDEDMPQMAYLFTDRILVNGLEQRWGITTEITAPAQLTPRENSIYRQLADMEYFYMGERGDKYRLSGWPKVLYTEYMIDSIGLAPEAFHGTNDTSGVGIIDIHFSYVGSNESVQKSEKDICIILPNGSSGEALKLAQAIKAAGVKVTHKKFDKTEVTL